MVLQKKENRIVVWYHLHQHHYDHTALTRASSGTEPNTKKQNLNPIYLG